MTQLTVEAQQWLDKDGSGKDPSKLVAELSGYHQSEVAVRGFLHRSTEGLWSVASQPSLRSCCVGEKEKATLQAVLDTTFDKALLAQIVTVTGKLVVDPQWNGEGSLDQVYRIEGAKLSLQKRRSPLLPVVGLVAIAGLVGGGILYKKRRSR